MHNLEGLVTKEFMDKWGEVHDVDSAEKPSVGDMIHFYPDLFKFYTLCSHLKGFEGVLEVRNRNLENIEHKTRAYDPDEKNVSIPNLKREIISLRSKVANYGQKMVDAPDKNSEGEYRNKLETAQKDLAKADKKLGEFENSVARSSEAIADDLPSFRDATLYALYAHQVAKKIGNKDLVGMVGRVIYENRIEGEAEDHLIYPSDMFREDFGEMILESFPKPIEIEDPVLKTRPVKPKTTYRKTVKKKPNMLISEMGWVFPAASIALIVAGLSWMSHTPNAPEITKSGVEIEKLFPPSRSIRLESLPNPAEYIPKNFFTYNLAERYVLDVLDRDELIERRSEIGDMKREEYRIADPGNLLLLDQILDNYKEGDLIKFDVFHEMNGVVYALKDKVSPAYLMIPSGKKPEFEEKPNFEIQGKYVKRPFRFYFEKDEPRVKEFPKSLRAQHLFKFDTRPFQDRTILDITFTDQLIDACSGYDLLYFTLRRHEDKIESIQRVVHRDSLKTQKPSYLLGDPWIESLERDRVTLEVMGRGPTYSPQRNNFSGPLVSLRVVYEVLNIPENLRGK